MGATAKEEIQARIDREWKEDFADYAFIDGLRFAIEMIEAYEQKGGV